MQHGKPRLGRGIGHAHVNDHGGPFHTGHALAARAALKRNTGQALFALAALGVHPYFKVVGYHNLLGLNGSVEQQVDLALAAKLQTTGKQLYGYGQFVKVAPHHQAGQGKKNIVGKEKPDGLLCFLTHQHAAIIEQGLAHGGREFIVPAHPHHMPHGAHAHINVAGQA